MGTLHAFAEKYGGSPVGAPLAVVRDGRYSCGMRLSSTAGVSSTGGELRLPLRWIAILYGRVQADFALTTGVHSAADVVKAMMAGASVAMTASELLQKGPGRVADILEGVQAWMLENEYESIKQMQGSMSQQAVAVPAAYERDNYMRVLSSY